MAKVKIFQFTGEFTEGFGKKCSLPEMTSFGFSRLNYFHLDTKKVFSGQKGLRNGKNHDFLIHGSFQENMQFARSDLYLDSQG